MDGQKRFRVAAGSNSRDFEDRVPALVEAGADVLCLDSSDGCCVYQRKAIAFAIGTDFVMLGRYFARFDESPSRKVRVDGQYYKEYWGEGSRRAQNAARYGQGDEIAFEEGVDGFVPYAGSLYDNVELTRSKPTATTISCGATSLGQFHEEAVMVQVSERSYEQNTAEVRLRERSVDSGE